MVDIYVGPSREYYKLHKDILCNLTKISYFEAMFSGEFKEACNGTPSFPADKVVAFDVLFNWVYTNTLRPLVVIKQGAAKTFSWNVVDFYFLADKLCLPELQHRIIDVCRASLLAENALPTADLVVYAYSQTSPVRTPQICS
jgi:hypothetical protein